MQKIGKVYENIASECLRNWYPDMSASERRALLQRGDFEEIEALIGAKESIEEAAHAIRRALEKADLFLPLDFVDVVLWSDEPNTALNDARYKILTRGLSDEAKAEIAMSAIEAVHDSWVICNSEKFFDEERKDKRYMFLRTEMIGVDEAMKDYIFVEPIMIMLCIPPERQFLSRAYAKKRRICRQIYGLTKEMLPFYISRADYPPLTGSIAAAMSDPTTAAEIADQVIQHSGDPANW